MKKVITLQTPAKINLYLEVVNQRPDGYHNLVSLIQMIGLYDILSLEEADEGITLQMQNTSLPSDHSNLVFRAAALLKKHMVAEGSPQKGVSITLKKEIPVAAGLAGGSSDAVATLIGLNRLWSLAWPQEKLVKLALALGSDLPFFFYGPGAWITGRGEKVESVQAPFEGWAVLLHPAFPVSTASIFTAFSEQAGLTKNKTALNIAHRAERPSIRETLRRPVNDLEAITLKRFPKLSETKTLFQRASGNPVFMSGSGPTLFSLFDQQGEASETAERLKQMNHPHPFKVWVVPLLQHSPF